ncbi:MAG: hypothetical protein JWO93_2043 [Micrococcaceae bacterium]|jgi:hypothetical protein|nr:hypothetical protein [Micrococcaceae bacterium]
MTLPPGGTAPGPVPTPGPGWYPDPAGSGRFQWWDGTAWTGQLSGPRPVGPLGPRPTISESTPVYNPFIWLIATLPIIPLILLVSWNPVIRMRTVRNRQTVDPSSIFTLPYILLVGAAFLIFGISALMAYLDWEKLRRDGVVRPFHWAWVFLSREAYVIGRSVIVRQAAPGRGLAPVWVTIGIIVAAIVIGGIKVSVLLASVAAQLPA